MKGCCSWETVSTNGQKVCPGFVAIDAALESVKPPLRKQKKSKQYWAAYRPHADIFTQGGDVVLPEELLLPDEPTWLQRQAVYQRLLPEVEEELEARAASGQPATLTGWRATGVWATGPVDRTAAREDHLGGHSRRRVGLQEERSSLHAVTN